MQVRDVYGEINALGLQRVIIEKIVGNVDVCGRVVVLKINTGRRHEFYTSQKRNSSGCVGNVDIKTIICPHARIG